MIHGGIWLVAFVCATALLIFDGCALRLVVLAVLKVTGLSSLSLYSLFVSSPSTSGFPLVDVLSIPYHFFPHLKTPYHFKAS